MKKEWTIKKFDDRIVEQIQNTFNINRLTAILLNIRGITSIKECNNFLNPDLMNNLHNPFLMDDMVKAVTRVQKAIGNNEKICIYGDSDVDGVSSAALIFNALKQQGADIEVAVPDEKIGFGLDMSTVELYIQSECRLIITVDNGMTAFEPIKKAKENNIDTIIIDHHHPENNLPEAYAIINPKCYENYPFNNLSGVGVAYKFIFAYFFSLSPYFNRDIVTLDIETTGLNPDEDEIIEIGAIKARNFIEIERFEKLLKPAKPISHTIREITGITNELLEDAHEPSSIINDFSNFIKDSILVGHNIIQFDLMFLKRSFKLHLDTDIKNQTFDTLTHARKHLLLDKNNLDAVAAHFNISSPRNCHRALNDAYITGEIFRHYILHDEKIRTELIKYSEYAALGTLADIVPLINENRVIVKEGISKLRKTKNLGLETLLEKLKIEKSSIASKNLAWKIIPLLNAPGRMGRADYTLKLMLANDKDEASRLADKLIEINNERKRKQEIIYNDIQDNIKTTVDLIKDKILIFVLENYDHGVTGVIANRLKELYHRPVIVLILSEDMGVGSARSIEKLVIYDVFQKCEDLFIDYGGHKYAVGFTIRRDNIPEFKRRISEIVNKTLSQEELTPHLEIDAELQSELINLDLIRELEEMLQPYGESNYEPVLLIKKLYMENFITIGPNKNHLKIQFKSEGNNKMEAIWWNGITKDIELRIGQTYDIVFTLEINRWNKKESINLIINDMQLSGS